MKKHNNCSLSLHTMHRLTVKSVHCKLAGGKRLEELAESILSSDSIAVPHQRCFVQIQPHQSLKAITHYEECFKCTTNKPNKSAYMK